MSHYTKQDLINKWITETEKLIEQASYLLTLEKPILKWKESPGKWNILECIEHLNLYGDFYLPEIQAAIEKADKDTKKQIFKSGLLGNYFAQSMLPKAKLNTMKTFKDKDPIGRQLDTEVLRRFIGQQQDLIRLLKDAADTDLHKTKVKISISKWIRLQLGDTFQFFINHNIRHLQQSQSILQKQKELST